MSKKMRIAFVFPSTHYAMEAEDILIQEKLKPILQPVPSGLGLGCGTAVTVDAALETKAKSILNERNIPILALYDIRPDADLWQSRCFGDFCDIF